MADKKFVFEFDTQFKGMKISELEKEVKDLRDKLKDLPVASEEAAVKARELQEAQQTLRHAMAGATTEIKESGKSYDSLTLQMKQLKQAWMATTDETERAKLGKKINAINDELKDMDASVGVFSRNVGNYKDAFSSAFKEMGFAVGGVDKELLQLCSNPWGAVIGAIVLTMVRLIKAFKDSEDRMNELKVAMSSFQPVLDAIKQGFDGLAKLLSKGVTLAIEGIISSIGWLASKLDALGKAMGKDWGLQAKFDEYEKAAEKEKEVAEQQIAYTKRLREFKVKEAKEQKEIAELRAKVAEKDKYTNEERLGFLEKAIAKEGALAKERKYQAEENLRLMKIEAARSENNAEMNDKLAEAEARVYEEGKNYADAIRNLNKQKATLIEQIEKETSEAYKNSDAYKELVAQNEALKKAEEDRKDVTKRLHEFQIGARATELENLQMQYEEEQKLFIDNAAVLELLQEEHKAKIDEINKKYDDIDKKRAKETAEVKKGIFKDLTTAQESAIQNSARIAQASASLLSSFLDGLADAQDQNTKEGFERSKKLQIASATIQMITGIATALSGAYTTKSGPWDIALAAIQAASIGVSGAINIAKIKKTKFDGSGSSTSASASVPSVSTQALQSVNNSVQSVSQVTGASAEEQIKNTKVYVTETDIANTTNKVNVTQSEATY